MILLEETHGGLDITVGLSHLLRTLTKCNFLPVTQPGDPHKHGSMRREGIRIPYAKCGT